MGPKKRARARLPAPQIEGIYNYHPTIAGIYNVEALERPCHPYVPQPPSFGTSVGPNAPAAVLARARVRSRPAPERWVNSRQEYLWSLRRSPVRAIVAAPAAQLVQRPAAEVRLEPPTSPTEMPKTTPPPSPTSSGWWAEDVRDGTLVVGFVRGMPVEDERDESPSLFTGDEEFGAYVRGSPHVVERSPTSTSPGVLSDTVSPPLEVDIGDMLEHGVNNPPSLRTNTPTETASANGSPRDDNDVALATPPDTTSSNELSPDSQLE